MLENLKSPADLRGLSTQELDRLAGEIRDFLIEKVSRSGGHLGPNLGVVELTLAIHLAFESPRDVVVFDTGHQSYVHKILTGRCSGFDALRKRGGLAGYPSRSESLHDVVENSHASTALSWGDGISLGFQLSGQDDRFVVVVVGDGALTGGMSWEALNNIATAHSRNLIIVVNDNQRSYSPTIGGMATQSFFENLGLTYVGPVDGHDISAMVNVFEAAKKIGKPLIVHAITEKGRGHQPALEDVHEKFHAIGVVDPFTGIPINASGTTWTSIFSDELVEIGHARQDVVAISAAMVGPTGLSRFQENFPDRTIDVGIAEQHAVTSAAGMAFAGLHPVVAIYSTFLNRAFDQLLLDVALHSAGVTFVLDRAGITGDDGPSHNGVWDLALTGMVPTLKVAAPRDSLQLRELLREAIAISSAPTLLRFPKGEIAADIPAQRRVGDIDIVAESERNEMLIVGIGSFVGLALDVSRILEMQGISVCVADPRWVKPISQDLIELVRGYECVIVLEDGIAHAGIASALSEKLRSQAIDLPLLSIGVPLEFLEHSKRKEVLSDLGLTAEEIAISALHFHEREKVRSR
ncbi:MAG: 1-deoxy-D-xylulose-5-phosphate synthase [Actinobacteria bacterium]|nr:1-deoxy-D-xylulose-5-phosphate synthase [Actinomycetota bacterium]